MRPSSGWFSGGPDMGGLDMGMEPEQNEREHAVALAKAVEATGATGLSAGGGARLRMILDRH